MGSGSQPRTRDPHNNQLIWISLWNENWPGKTIHSEKTLSSPTLATANSTRFDLNENAGRGNTVINRPGYGTAVEVL